MSDKVTEAAALAVAIVGLIVGLPALMLVYAVLNGWVLTKLWEWFIVPTFHLPMLGLWMAIGLSLVTHTLTRVDCENKRKFAESLALAVITPLMALGFGWLTHWIYLR